MDIKKVVAYSTCSQLGYMFVGLGVGGYSLGIFHLFTHAFFKALLFLGCGSVIVAMHHEQDIRNMGGLKDKIPFTYWTMVIGSLALTGFPLTSGYFSKDAIIEAAFVGTNPMAFYGYLCTTIAAMLTAFYSWRLLYKTFHGRPHDVAHYEAAHESPLTMLIPLGALAVGCFAAGWPFEHLFVGSGVESFFRDSLKFSPDNHIFEDMEHISWPIRYLPTLMMAIGWASLSVAAVLVIEQWTLNLPLSAALVGAVNFIGGGSGAFCSFHSGQYGAVVDRANQGL